MTIRTVKEFRDRATKLLRSRDPILVMRRGELAGIFFPCPEKTLPLELKRELFPVIVSEVTRQMRKKRVTEVDLATGFKEWKRRRQHRGAQLKTGA
ncbi:MAG: hypothetical protein AB1714_03865 [Acidobacteriota bacterium]